MDKTLTIISRIIAIIMALLIIWFLLVKLGIIKPIEKLKTVEKTIVKTEIIPGDPVPVEVIKEVPKYIYVDTGSTIIKYMPVDTMAILQDYFAEYFYSDTIRSNDTTVLAIINDWITQNKLSDRKIYIQNLRPKKVEQLIITQQKNQFFIGIGTGIGTDNLLINVQGSLINNKRMYSLGLGNVSGNTLIMGSVNYKLGK